MTTKAILAGEHALVCPSCNGTGRARRKWRAGDGRGGSWWEKTCFWCLGDGVITRPILARYLERFPHGEPTARPRQLRLSEVSE